MSPAVGSNDFHSSSSDGHATRRTRRQVSVVVVAVDSSRAGMLPPVPDYLVVGNLKVHPHLRTQGWHVQVQVQVPLWPLLPSPAALVDRTCQSYQASKPNQPCSAPGPPVPVPVPVPCSLSPDLGKAPALAPAQRQLRSVSLSALPVVCA